MRSSRSRGPRGRPTCTRTKRQPISGSGTTSRRPWAPRPPSLSRRHAAARRPGQPPRTSSAPPRSCTRSSRASRRSRRRSYAAWSSTTGSPRAREAVEYFVLHGERDHEHAAEARAKLVGAGGRAPGRPRRGCPGRQLGAARRRLRRVRELAHGLNRNGGYSSVTRTNAYAITRFPQRSTPATKSNSPRG